jgi:nucleoside-diphosphate-sugar epimerase
MFRKLFPIFLLEKKIMSKVFITGGAGYVGSVLTDTLLQAGHQVTVADRFFFGVESLAHQKNNGNLSTLKIDIRDISPKNLIGQDVVIDLAALSNDPAGDLNPKLTFEINENGRVHVANQARIAGVPRYILSSTCSVYGGSQNICDENSPTSPLSTYAQAAKNAEDRILDLLELGVFEPIVFRNGTVHGVSSRMRFDLVVNVMTRNAFQNGVINILGSGSQWRPLIHTSELANTFLTAVDSSKGSLAGEIFNIATCNERISTIAFQIRDVLPISVNIKTISQDEDKRDYRVSIDKAKKNGLLKSKINIGESALQIYNLLLKDSTIINEKSITVEWYKKILESKALLDAIELNGRLI